MKHMIVFTDHAKDKLQKEFKKLGITEQLIAKILENPDELLYDALRERYVAISWSHNAAVIFEKTDDNLVVVTIIYSGQLRHIVNRRKRIGRWI